MDEASVEAMLKKAGINWTNGFFVILSSLLSQRRSNMNILEVLISHLKLIVKHYLTKQLLHSGGNHQTRF
jgi:hypothetical protein